MKKTLFVLCFFVLLLLGALYQWGSTQYDRNHYPPPGTRHDIGGYDLHILTEGSQGPTVVLDAGMGLNSLDWSLVQPKIAKFACVCSFDRAGYGWSDTSPLKRTSKNMVHELHKLLNAAGLPGPYILVGHSFGGANVRLYASYYPEEVFGVVLVDATNENQLTVLPPPPPPNRFKTLFLANEGITRFINYLPKNRKNYEMFPKLVQKEYLATTSSTKAIKALLGEQTYCRESLSELKEAGGFLGDRPLIVISAGIPLTPAETGLSKLETIIMTFIWNELQKELLTKSTRSKQIIAKKSNHMIPRYEPDIIVRAVHELVHEYRHPPTP